MSLIKEYLELTKKYSDEYGELTIVLMQNGAFFEVYGLKDKNDNIYGCKLTDFSRICDLNIVDKKVPGGDMTIDGDQVVNGGFKTHLIEKYIKKLQDNGYTIIVYEEEGEDPVKKTKIRNQTGIYSPGTYFYPEPDTEQITNNICCLWIETKKGSLKTMSKSYIYVGVGLVDIYTGNTCINEYNDEYIKNPTTFDNLERFISIYNPSETIIVSNLQKNDINDIISFINLRSKSLHIVNLLDEKTSMKENKNIIRATNCEKQTYQTELLSKFYKINDINAFMSVFYDNVYATQAFCFLLDFVYQHNPYLIQKISEPILENTSKKMILANHSLKQLNVIDDDNYRGKYSSVSKMLNECITPMGKRKFTNNFLNPVTDEDYLQKEYDIIDSLLSINGAEEYKVVKVMLVQIKDISKIMRLIIMQKASPKLLYQLYSSICSAKIIYNFVIGNEDLLEYLKYKLPDFVSLIDKADNIINYLNEVLILDECKDIDNISKIEKSFIQNGVDPLLDNKIKTLMDSQDQLEACRSYFSSLISNYETAGKSKKTTKKKKVVSTSANEDEDLSTGDNEEDTKEYVNIHETEKNNFSLLATERRCKILDEMVKNSKSVTLKYYSSYTGIETTFNLSLDLEYNKQSQSKKSITNNQINGFCKNVGSVKVILIDTVSKVYQQIVKKLQEYQADVESINNFITYVDLVYTKAFIAVKYNYCKPEIVANESGKSFVRATDLRHCLIEKIQQIELYVANDINIGDGNESNNVLDGILLYGTNAVGKTSFIRALGISIIMAQAGLYVPASSYKYRPYKYIFTRILGNDNIFKGLSTFAVEMSELRTILRLADKNSMVLGDELCSGTESISAVSIFVAGIQKLTSVGCSFIFATHLHEIIDYDEIVSLHNVGMKHMSVIFDKEKDCLIYNRKLQDGPGNNMYGLEVCKSLNLPQDFLDNAHNIRIKYHPESGSLLARKGSHFNAKHITGGLCENCKINPAADVHHLVFQNEADQNGTVKKKGLTFKKNDKANLMNLCEKCHDEMHKTNKKYKRTKTTKGTILEEV
jgi:DNA mismatch repair protein MutS